MMKPQETRQILQVPLLSREVKNIIQDLLVNKGLEYYTTKADGVQGMKTIAMLDGGITVMTIDLDGNDFDSY